jgi:hypothetical protein
VLVVGVLLASTGCDSGTSSNSQVGDTSGPGLLAAYVKTVQAGPTHFIATETGVPYGPRTYTGVEDLAHNAAEYILDGGGEPAADLGIAGVTYLCTPRGSTTIIFVPGYCDASKPWLLLPPSADVTDAATSLNQVLMGRLQIAGWSPSAQTVRHLGKTTVRGAAVTGYAFDLDGAALDAALQNASLPQHDISAAVHVWVDASGLVREFKLDFQSTLPGIASPPPPTGSGLYGELITPPANPSLAAEQSAMASARPAADRTPDVPTPTSLNQLTRSTTVQLWDIGTAPLVQAPPIEAVLSPPPTN